jgi:hypothetical protein
MNPYFFWGAKGLEVIANYYLGSVSIVIGSKNF